MTVQTQRGKETCGIGAELTFGPSRCSLTISGLFVDRSVTHLWPLGLIRGSPCHLVSHLDCEALVLASPDWPHLPTRLLRNFPLKGSRSVHTHHIQSLVLFSQQSVWLLNERFTSTSSYSNTSSLGLWETAFQLVFHLLSAFVWKSHVNVPFLDLILVSWFHCGPVYDVSTERDKSIQYVF